MKPIRDPDEYENGSKWFARWHRAQGDDTAASIDLDSVGYCRRCKHAVYMVEATRGQRRKNADVTEGIGRRLGVTVWVVYQDKAGGHPGQILVHDRTTGINHGWLDEAVVWSMLMDLRRGHVCEAIA